MQITSRGLQLDYSQMLNYGYCPVIVGAPMWLGVKPASLALGRAETGTLGSSIITTIIGENGNTLRCSPASHGILLQKCNTTKTSPCLGPDRARAGHTQDSDTRWAADNSLLNLLTHSTLSSNYNVYTKIILSL